MKWSVEYLHDDKDFFFTIKWAILIRLIFTILLLSATIFLQFSYGYSPFEANLLILYGIVGIIFFLSLCYLLLLPHVTRTNLFVCIQIGLDTILVTAIVFSTGGFSSIFSFCYLVVVIYSSMILLRNGCMIVAALCSIQYGIIINLEYYGIIDPFLLDGGRGAGIFDFEHVVYNLIITMGACFAVAFLSSFLSEQILRSKKELKAMEDHVKRVDRLALMGSMGAGLAHDLKNPIAALTGSIQLLRDDLQYNPNHDKLVQIILREANRLSSLANNFLLLARPPSGQLVPLELGRELAQLVDFFKKDNSHDHKILLTCNPASEVWIEMDPEHFRQIFWNLVLNAAQAIDTVGSITININLLPNNYVEVKISDTGCGIPADKMKSIFDPFFTTKSQGTGLGLSIVHSILEIYDGQINVESKLAHGTTFSLRFRVIDIADIPNQSLTLHPK